MSEVSTPNEYSAFQQGEVAVENITLVNAEQEYVDLTYVCSNLKLYEGIDKYLSLIHI